MHPLLDLADFKRRGLSFGSDVKVLGDGGEGVVIQDRGTALKFMWSSEARPPECVKADAEREVAMLDWFNRHNTTSLFFPKALNLLRFEEPVLSGGQEYHMALRMTLVPGESAYRLSASDQQSAVRRTHESWGAAIAEMHGMTKGVLPPAGLPEAKAADTSLFDRALNEYRSVYISPDELQALKELGETVRRQSPPGQVIHRDLQMANVLFGKNRACAVVDFTQAGLGTPEQDLAACVSGRPDWQARFGQLLNGYRSVAAHQPDLHLVAMYNLLGRSQTILEYEQRGHKSTLFEDILIPVYEQAKDEMARTGPVPKALGVFRPRHQSL